MLPRQLFVGLDVMGEKTVPLTGGVVGARIFALCPLVRRLRRRRLEETPELARRLLLAVPSVRESSSSSECVSSDLFSGLDFCFWVLSGNGLWRRLGKLFRRAPPVGVPDNDFDFDSLFSEVLLNNPIVLEALLLPLVKAPPLKVLLLPLKIILAVVLATPTPPATPKLSLRSPTAITKERPYMEDWRLMGWLEFPAGISAPPAMLLLLREPSNTTDDERCWKVTNEGVPATPPTP